LEGKYFNRWNRREYTLVKDKGSTVVLRRDNGTELEINKSELNFSYTMKKEK